MLQTILILIFLPLCLITLGLAYVVYSRPWKLPPPPESSSGEKAQDALAVQRSRQLMEEMLQTLSGRVETFARDARQYGHNLEQHRDALQKAGNMRSIREVEQLLLSEVDAMRRANESYRQQLEVANRTISEQQKRMEELALDATLDFLTQVPNRRALDKRLHEEIERFRRGGPPFCIALIDIDHFKLVNDTHGHAAGDTVLRRVARLLDQNRRVTDMAGRFGGEEFALILPGTVEHAAGVIVDRLREMIRELSFTGQHGEAFRVTFSAGVAEMLPADQGTVTLIQRADERLYRAKQQGRNRVLSA